MVSRPSTQQIHTYLYLMLQAGLGVELKEEFVGGHVKDRDDFLWIAHQLGVQVWAVVEQVTAVHIQVGVLKGVDLQTRGQRSEDMNGRDQEININSYRFWQIF